MRYVAYLAGPAGIAALLGAVAPFGSGAVAASKSRPMTIAPCGKMPCAIKGLKTKTREPPHPGPRPWLKANPGPPEMLKANPGPPERR
jgi:hypothetical protein